MNALCPQSRFRQHGIVSIVAAIVLIAVVILVLSQSHDIVGNTSNANQTQKDSVSAFFLAESGIERAQAVIASAAAAGTLTNATCTSTGMGSGNIPLGGGGFQYTSFASTPNPCGGVSQPACSTCTVEVQGQVNTSTRVLRTTISTTPSEGLEGCGSQFTIPMPVVAPGNGVVFSHVAYRAKPSSSGCSVGSFTSNARVGNCTNTGGTCDVSEATGDFWDTAGTGTNAISSMGVSAGAPSIGTDYTITTRLEEGTGGPATRGTNPSVVRDYAQSAVLFYPLPGSPVVPVTFMGSYGTAPQASGYNGNLPKDWTCQPKSATASNQMGRAAASDALVYGFSGWKANSAATSLSAVNLGIQPLRRLTSIDGTQAEPVYSQIWMSYNFHYDSTVTASGTPVASSGAVIRASIGATVKSTTASFPAGSGSATLTLTSDLNTNAILSVGDKITSCTQSGGGTCEITIGTLVAGTGTTAGSTFNVSYIVTGATATFPNSGATANSNVLHLVTAASDGVLTAGDEIKNSAETTSYGTLPGTVLAGTWGAAESTYTLIGSRTYVASPNSGTNMLSSGTTITITGGTPSSAPAAGTALAVWSGSGTFAGTVFTGSITGGTPTLTATLAANDKICAGDALFSGGFKEPLPSTLEQGIKSNTTVVSPAGCSTGPGTFTYTLSRAVDVTMSGASILARAAATGTPGATSFTVSRPPASRISGANVCGGVCAMFYAADGTLPTPNIGFTLGGFTSGNDWTSGFACLKGVDSANIQTLGKKVAKRSLWTEVVR